MIHSKDKDPNDIVTFLKTFRKEHAEVPLVVVPTTYNGIYESELADAGANLVIYANHLLRSAYPAMVHTAQLILTHERALEADAACIPIREILTLIPEK